MVLAIQEDSNLVTSVLGLCAHKDKTPDLMVWGLSINKDPGDDLLRVACFARNSNVTDATKTKPRLIRDGVLLLKKTLAMTYSCMA